MTDFLQRVAVKWWKTLDAVLARANEVQARGVAVFDLDSTVFDNRPRQARIVREYGAAHGLNGLLRCQAWHFSTGWDLKPAALACGLTEDEYVAHQKPLKSYWSQRFFTPDYCADDVEIVGAPRYLNALAQTGVQLVYLTGRQEDMRPGSVACLRRCGMPVPAAHGPVRLLMKPSLHESDDAYKRVAHAQLHELGTVIAAFDNEPTHVNDYAKNFPEAIAVHLATDHSGRPVTIDPRVISIPHFAY
jgi:hypothetical protein